jgi:kynurenine formamidase
VKKTLILSHIINDRTPLYGGERSIVIKKVKSIRRGDPCNKTYCSFSAHTGTHIDAPKHFFDKRKAVSELSPNDLFFRKICLVKVKDVKPGQIIRQKDLRRIKNCELLFIKTGFEKHRDKPVYWKNSPALDDKLAPWLKKSCPSIKAVGIDFISISNLKNRELGRQAHKAFLGKDIYLIEDMRLRGVKKAPTSVIIAPLFFENAEAAPCTVLGINN